MALGGAALNTKILKLRYLEEFYAYADSVHGPLVLDNALAKLDTDKLAELLEGYFITLKNKPVRTTGDEARWKTIHEFVTTVVTWQSRGNPQSALVKAAKRFLHLDNLYKQLHVQRPRKQDLLRALPANVVAALYEMLDPVSATNPFRREKTRWMVFVIFIVLLHQGLRRGELLLQPVNAVKSADNRQTGQRRYWLNVDTRADEVDDPRYNRPSIKTDASLRQVPVSELTASIIQTYTENYRGKAKHPFLLNSAMGTPLSMEGVTAIFGRISDALPKQARIELEDRTGKTSITAHDLRHTSAVVRLNQLLDSNVEMELALQKLRTFFGWSRTSDMPRKYARAVFEDRLANIWSNILDDRVAVLNALPKSKP